MNHEPITIRQIAAEVTARHIGEDENRDAIRDDFDEWVAEAIETGQLSEPVPTARELRKAWAWQQAGAEANAIGQRIRKSLARGQTLLEFAEESLDVMLVVCEKRRTTLRLMTADDLVLMAAESRENRRKIEQADEDLQAGIAGLVPILRRYANFGEYRVSAVAA